MKTIAISLVAVALAGCGPAPVTVSTRNNEVGRYQICQSRNPGDPQQVLVMKLDTVTGSVEQLEVKPFYQQDADGYADTKRPYQNKDGSIFGNPYWKVMATTPYEADINNYRPSN